MAWDERLFGRLHRALTIARRQRRVRPFGPEAATLDALAPRLRLLACALAGVDVALVLSDVEGAPCGTRIPLPPAIALAPTREQNTQLFQLRVAHAAASLGLGLVVPDEAEENLAALHALLAVPAVLATCARELPGVPAIRAALARVILDSRPDPARLSPGEAALEALAQLHLGRPAGELASRVRPEALAWAEAAAARSPVTPTALRLAVHECSGGGFGRGQLAPVVLWGALPVRQRDASAPAIDGPGALPSASCTERERPRPLAEPRPVELGTDPAAENPAVHSFEKVRTAEEYRGGKKRVDAEDELAEHADALDELDLREVVRSAERTRSLYRADLMLDGGVGDLEGPTPALDAIPYDEWDARQRRYRPGWCSLRASRLAERLSPAEAVGWCRATSVRHRAQIRSLGAAFSRIEQARCWKGRQPDGPDIDIDALVQRHADIRSGHAPPDRVYAARRRHGHDVAILILLDASLSTDAWVAGRRVLDVARESVLVLGEALAMTPITVGIAAFASHTRRDCRFATVKGFAEPWADGARRLASVEAAGYTRIGTALRHGTCVLERAPARRRLLLLVSDGKPTDYDRYEGRYGVADVRQAVREAQRRAIGVFALAVDAAPRSHLPQLFGKGNYALLPRPDALTDALARVVAEAMR